MSLGINGIHQIMDRFRAYGALFASRKAGHGVPARCEHTATAKEPKMTPKNAPWAVFRAPNIRIRLGARNLLWSDHDFRNGNRKAGH